LNLLETYDYVSSRIKAAGAVPANVFTREAVKLIHERSHGNPRTINVIADNALIVGLATQLRPVPAWAVAEVCGDFEVTPVVAMKLDPSPERSVLPIETARTQNQPVSASGVETDSAPMEPTKSAARFSPLGWRTRRDNAR
jgi:hypothetical protein